MAFEAIFPNQTISASSPVHNHHKFKVRHCEYGLHRQCDHHQECYIPKHSHSRTGICRCEKGYQFDSDNKCVSIGKYKKNQCDDRYILT